MPAKDPCKVHSDHRRVSVKERRKEAYVQCRRSVDNADALAKIAFEGIVCGVLLHQASRTSER